MKRVGKPYDWNRIRKLESFGTPPKWRAIKVAVAYMVMRRFFAGREHYVKVIYDSDINTIRRSSKIRQVIDTMADQILMLGGFEDDRIRRKNGGNNVE